MNEQFSAHVTSTAFNLTLSKPMIRALVRQDLIRAHDYCTKGFQRRPRGQASPDNYIATLHALEDRGLIVWSPRPLMFRGENIRPAVKRRMAKHDAVIYEIQDPDLIKITRPGRLVISLLKEAGIYEDFAKDIRPIEGAA